MDLELLYREFIYLYYPIKILSIILFFIYLTHGRLVYIYDLNYNYKLFYILNSALRALST